MTKLLENQVHLGKHEESDTVDLAALISAIWRGKWIIAFFAIVLTVAATYYAFAIATPQYRSTVVVIIEVKKESVLDLQSVAGGFSGDSTAVNSEIEILRARSLMRKVVERLDLMNDPEFNAALQSKGYADDLKNIIRNLFRDEEDVATTPSPVDRSEREMDSVITALLAKVTIKNVPLSLVFQITATSQRRWKSALIADTIAEQYIVNQLAVKFEATERATTWLSQRVTELQSQLEVDEGKVSDFNANIDLVSVDVLQGLERQIKDTRDRIKDAEERVAITTDRFNALNVTAPRAEQAERGGRGFSGQLLRWIA